MPVSAHAYKNIREWLCHCVLDRIILMPGGCVAFAELKAPGKKMRPIQERRKRQLESLGFNVYLIDSLEQIGGMIDEIQRT